jgi:hypothetical protein
MTDTAGMLAELAKRGTRVPAGTELDRFAAYVASGAIIAHASAFHVYAERGDSERSYKPDGGLTEAVYRLGENDEERAILARGILESDLVRRGHGYRAVRDTLGMCEADELRDLVDAHSFAVVADALEEVVSAPAAEPRPGRLAQTAAEVARDIGEGAGPAPDHEQGVLAAVLRRLDALEETSVRPPAPSAAWEVMARSIARIADALDPPPPDIVDSTYVARRLGCTTTWIADQARSGDIPRRCIVAGTGRGKPWKFHRGPIDEWIESR